MYEGDPRGGNLSHVLHENPNTEPRLDLRTSPTQVTSTLQHTSELAKSSPVQNIILWSRIRVLLLVSVLWEPNPKRINLVRKKGCYEKEE